MFLYILAILLSATGAWLVSKYGRRFNLLDHPNDRSSHQMVTPRGGGVGILAGFTIAAIALRLPVTLWAPVAILSAISFCSDRFEIAPMYRLLFQFAAGIIVLMGLWNGNSLFSPGYVMLPGLLIFIVATVNYYNFMDGINGIAGITGVVSFGLLSFYSFSSGNTSAILILSICMALGCLGFLPFNIPKARVFMGDVGSILLGFVFAVLVILLSKSLLDFVCLASFLFPFYADELTTELVRLKHGEKLWRPHRRHLYQLLANEYGIPHWKVSLGYGLGQLLVGISVLFFVNLGLLPVLLMIFLYFCIFTVITSAIRMRLTSKSA